jgi:signal transduction histidine kinase
MPNANIEIIQHPQRLARLRSLGLLDAPRDAAFDRLARLASKILNVPISKISLVDADRQFFAGEYGMTGKFAEARQTPLTHSYSQHVVATREPLIVSDARQHPLTYDSPAINDIHAIAYAGVPIRISSGDVLGSFCVIDTQPRDWTPDQIALLHDMAESVITEIELREQLRERDALLSQLRELEQLKTDMIRIAVHDLKNPLNVIHGFADLLKEQVGATEREFIVHIQGAVRDMNRIVVDILSMERIEEMARSGVTERVWLAGEVRRGIDAFQFQALEAEVTLETAIDNNTYVIGDSTQLLEAIRNLLGNAIRYTPKGGHITVTVVREDNEVVFTVQDTGYGIPEQFHARIFQPFYRAVTPQTEHIKSTGLGLHIVKNIVARHHGRLIFASVYQQGSTFGFALPAAPDEPAE